MDSLTKTQRSLIHNTVKDVYGKLLVGSTVEIDGKKHVKFARYAKGGKHHFTKIKSNFIKHQK